MNLDAKVNNQIKRNDYPIIIALKRELATILPVRLQRNTADTFVAGLVLGRVTATGYYKAYDDAASDGSQTAVAVLMDDVALEDRPDSSPSGAASGTSIGRGIFSGYLFKDKLTGLDANGITDLGAKTIVDASGVNILKF